MSDDYLWDGSGPPDPDVERLEQMLGRLRSTPPVPDMSKAREVRPTANISNSAKRYLGIRFFAPALAAAAAIVAMVGGTWETSRSAPSWQVASISGTPRIGSRTLAGDGRFAV